MTSPIEQPADNAPDVAFVVGPQTFTAHSRILSTRSLYFHQLLQRTSPPTPQTPLTLHLPAFITPPSFESLLSYLYTQTYIPPTPPSHSLAPVPLKKEEKTLLYAVSAPTIPFTTPSLLVELYRLAMEYQLEELRGLVAKDIVGRCKVETVWEFKRKAVECGVQMVIGMADAFVKRNGLVEPPPPTPGGGGLSVTNGDGGGGE
ncbi:hypothetical protein HK097_003459, partial [Rhizophlyctis rosea]